MRRDRGFTVLETLLATFVPATVMMALFNLFPMTAMAIHRAEMRTFGNGIAQEFLEGYRARSFASVPLGAAPRENVTLQGTRFDVDTLVYTPSGARPELLKAVRVAVSWTDRGRACSVEHEEWLVHGEE